MKPAEHTGADFAGGNIVPGPINEELHNKPLFYFFSGFL
jgi:hypothetical protein